jgi:hypothetical protein
MTAPKQNSRTASTRSQSWCVAVGIGRPSRANAVTITKYAPAKKIPAFTRPRSEASTTARRNDRATRIAMAMAGRGQAAAHSCARLECIRARCG